MRFAISLLAIVTLFFAGCHKVVDDIAITGSGKTAMEERAIGAFTELSVETVCRVEVVSGDKPSLQISADDNLLPVVTTAVRDGVLRIETTKSFSTEKEIHVKIVSAGLGKLQMKSTSDVTIGKATADEFEVKISGASTLRWNGEAKKLSLAIKGASTAELKGTVENLSVDCAGASTVKAFDAAAANVAVIANGASTVEIAPKEKLNAKASGASTVIYSTKPAKLEMEAKGASSIRMK